MLRNTNILYEDCQTYSEYQDFKWRVIMTNPLDYKEVREHKGAVQFPIYWLHVQAFCEYQIYLQHYKGIKGDETPQLLKGKEVHDQLEIAHLEKAEPISIPDALQETQEKDVQIVFRELGVSSNKYGIYGRIDEVWLRRDFVVVIDDKPGGRDYLTNRRQVWGYCLAFDETIPTGRELLAAIRNRDSQHVTWKQSFSEEDRNDVIRAIQRTHRLIRGEQEFMPTKNPKKCRGCRFRPQCERSLV